MHKPFEHGWEMQDFYRKKKVMVRSQEDLYSLYEESAQEHVEYTLRKWPEMKRFSKDNYTDWLVKQGICPQSIITKSSKYWLETILFCDGEMGVSLPGAMSELPNLFFEALRTVRKVKGEIREAEEKSGE